jgi:hypothetical integral membrane protein (TIGR02206 family)
MLDYPGTGAVCLLLMAANVAAGLWLRRRGRERTYAWLLGGLALAVWAAITIWYLLPANFAVHVSLPLHVCDLAALIGPLAILTRWRLLRAVLYFWAIVLTTQAFITPVLRTGPETTQYWLFWANHTVVVGLSIYDLVVGRFRPMFSDLLGAIGFTSFAALFVVAINLAYDVNYWYLGRASLTVPTLLDHLGDWPMRMIWMFTLVIGGFAVAWLPWAIAGLFARRAGTPGRRAN